MSNEGSVPKQVPSSIVSASIGRAGRVVRALQAMKGEPNLDIKCRRDVRALDHIDAELERIAQWLESIYEKGVR